MGIISNVINRVKKSMVHTQRVAIPEFAEILDGQAAQRKMWRDMYLNNAPWVKKNINSLNLAAVIAAEVSRLVTLEIKSTVDDAGMDAIYQREVMRDLREKIEYGLALGGLVMKPYVLNGIIRVDFAQPSDFQIVNAANDGTILEIFFKDFVEYRKAYYIRLEYHKFDEVTGRYLITNRFYRSDEKGYVGSEIEDYSFIDRWAQMEREFELVNIKAPLFGYFRPAISNNIDTKSVQGVSIYSRAVGAIQRADEGLAGMLREFRVKEAKQYVSELAVKGTGPLPYLEDDYYIRIRTDGKNGETFFQSYSPDINVGKYLDALNEYKREIEDCIGLAHGTISDPENMVKTATELKMSKQRTYVLVTENQKNLQDCFKSVVYAMGVWLKYPGQPPEYVVTTDFDDSMITDWEEEVKGMLNDVAAGLIRPEIYLSKKYGVTEEEALKMIPDSVALGVV